MTAAAAVIEQQQHIKQLLQLVDARHCKFDGKRLIRLNPRLTLDDEDDKGCIC